MNLEDLKPNQRNPRKITDKKQVALRKALAEFGDLGGIVFNIRTGQLIGGHQRQKALPKGCEIVTMKTFEPPTPIGTIAIGYVETPEGERFSYREVDWPEEKEKAANIAANKGAGEWDNDMLKDWFKDLDSMDFDLDLTMFDEDERAQFFIEPDVIEEGLTDEDEIPEQVETRCKPGDLWLLGNHRLLCGDSTNPLLVEKLLNGSQPILMVTDPPYGVEYDPNWRNDKNGSIAYGATNVGKVQNDDRVDWSGTWALFGAQVAYVWHAGKFVAEVAKSLTDCDYEIISHIIWAKPSFAISRGDYHWQHESCWYANKKGKKHNWQGARDQSTLWKIEKGCKEKTGHGTEKPVECMERPIRNNTEPNELVVDPFLGSGTTLIACEKTKRECYGMEIDPKYCDVIIERWERFTGQKAILAENVE